MENRLSDTAKALLGALWINPKFTLRYAMVESVPSQKAESALTELVSAGVLSRKTEVGGAVVYAMTKAGAALDRKPKGGMAFIKKHGSFPLSQPKPSTPTDVTASAERGETP